MMLQIYGSLGLELEDTPTFKLPTITEELRPSRSLSSTFWIPPVTLPRDASVLLCKCAVEAHECCLLLEVWATWSSRRRLSSFCRAFFSPEDEDLKGFQDISWV